MTKRIQEYMVLLACVLTAGTFLALAITNSITGPLGRLQQTAERLGKGDLDAKADLGSLEEINVLARTFNHMSERIRRLLEKIPRSRKICGRQSCGSTRSRSVPIFFIIL